MAIETPNPDQSAEIRMREAEQVAVPAAPTPEVDREAIQREVTDAANEINAYGDPKAWSLDANGSKISQDPVYDKLRARVDAAAGALQVSGRRDAHIFTPEENARIQEVIAERDADKALMEKITAGGVLDATNPAEVAAAMRIIKRETGRDARLSVDELGALANNNSEATMKGLVGPDQNVQDAVADEKLRVRVDELTTPFKEGERVPAEIFSGLSREQAVRIGTLNEQFEKDPSGTLTRQRKILITLDEQYDKKPAIYEVVNREGESVTLSRVDRLGPDGKELADPKDWKVLVKKVSVADIVSKKPRMAA